MSTLEVILNKFNIGDFTKVNMPIDLLQATRLDLADLFCELKFETGVEIGVQEGLYSEQICLRNPNLKKHYSIDGWKAYRGYRDHVNQTKMDNFYAEAKSRLSKYPIEIIKSFSLDAIKNFKDNSLDYVYIDGNHSFDHVIQDIIQWSAKVRPGGIIAGHDFIRRIMEPVHVIQATQVYTYCHKISPWFTVGGSTKETRSFFWIKV